MELFVWQILFILAIFVTVMICCLIPIVILGRTAYRSSDGAGSAVNECWTRVLGWFNCLTGGVFLAMCFLGLLPNVHQQMSAVLEQSGWTSDLPVAECVVLLGFFLVLTVDQVSRHCEGVSSNKAASRLAASRKMEMGLLELAHGTLVEDDVRRTLLAKDDDWDDEDDEEEAEVVTSSDGIAPGRSCSKANGSRVEDSRNGQTQQQFDTSSPTVATPGGGGGHSHDHVINLLADSAPRGMRFFVLLFALSTHALFEGIVLGLQREEAAAVHLFAAIVLHEAVVAVTLGFNIAKARHSAWTAVRYSLLFGATIPVGIGLGMAIGETPGTAGHLISGSLQGAAAGIFLHITFMQLLPEEFSRGRDGLVKTLFLFIGFLLLLALNLAMGGKHH